jgi:putative ABC transport system permease protein
MDALFQDVRQGLRALKANPFMASVAVLSLALGIGPNTAIFSVIDAVGLRPLAVRDPGGLLRVSASARGDSLVDSGSDFSYPEYMEVRDGLHRLDSVAASGPQMLGMRVGTYAAEVALASMVSANYFDTVGVLPARGRSFRQADETTSNGLVAVISDRLWRRRFDADPLVVGRTLRINMQDFTVVGVMPAGFNGTLPVLTPELWLPISAWPVVDPRSTVLRARDQRSLTLSARLKPRVTLGEARAEADAMSSILANPVPGPEPPRRLSLVSEETLRRRPAALVGAMTIAIESLILLIACANVAGLLLGRAEARRSEVAIRVAMGANRGRLVRQLLVESALVSVAAGAAGVVLAWWLVRLIPTLIPAMPISVDLDFRIDVRVLGYTLVVALGAAPIFGLLPALMASRTDLTPLMKGGPTRRHGVRGLPLRHVLVVGEIAVALVLLVASGLFVRSFVTARAIDPGFVPRPMVFSTMAPGVIGYDQARARQFYTALLARLEAVPGVERASLVRHLPLNTLYGGGATYEIRVDGHDAAANDPTRVRYNIVEASYFETMGVAIVAGRGFDGADRGTGPAAAIVNETMARRFWSGRDPIGQYFTMSSGGKTPVDRQCQVVGIARDGKYLHISEEPQPYFYVPFGQQFSGEMTVIARHRADPAAIAAAFRREVQALDPAMPTLQVVTLEEHLRLALIVERVLAALMGVLGGLGLLLSVIGLYAVVSYLAARRTREIGIRIAVGASPGQVIRSVLAHAGRLTAVGLGLGVAIAAAAMPNVGSRLLNGVSPHDPLVYGAVVFIVLTVALAASYVPARRAARVDPVAALRAE